jgi:predicted ATP-grasp superfamily ATP-dependent carboligase
MGTAPAGVVLSLFATGLGAVRSLAAGGVDVIGMDSDPAMPGFRSRRCRAELCPDPVTEPDALVQYLLERTSSIPRGSVVFPASDAFVLFLSRHREALADHYRFALPEGDVLEAIIDKRKQYDLAERAGIPYPATHYPETSADVERIADGIDYPVLVKPYVGHLWRARFGGEHKGFKVHDGARLREVFEEILEARIPAMVQSLVLGPNTNHYKLSAYVAQDGEPQALFGLRKIRQYPPEFGVGTLVESVDEPEVTDLGLRFLRAVGYRGIGSVELKRDERDGGLKLIELNPRLWQQSSLATACGLNFPMLQYADLTGHPPVRPAPYRTGVRWLDAIPDFQSFRAQRKTLGAGWWDWPRSLRRVRAFSTFSASDPRPYLYENLWGLRYLRLPYYLLKQRRAAARERAA